MSLFPTFRALERADLVMLAGWLEEPLVKRWWNHETTPEAMERDFGAIVDGTDPTEVLVVSDGDVSFGLIQRYELGATPAYVEELSALLPVTGTMLGIDYLIADPGRRGRGSGAAMIAALVASSWAAYPDAPAVVVPVSAGNPASWRSLERAGFTRAAAGDLEPDNPIDPRDHVVYVIERPTG